jgi:hypothetical protein
MVHWTHLISPSHLLILNKRVFCMGLGAQRMCCTFSCPNNIVPWYCTHLPIPMLTVNCSEIIAYLPQKISGNFNLRLTCSTWEVGCIPKHLDCLTRYQTEPGWVHWLTSHFFVSTLTHFDNWSLGESFLTPQCESMYTICWVELRILNWLTYMGQLTRLGLSGAVCF